MKKQIFMLAASVVVLVTMAAVTTTQAQTITQFTADIPFDFQVGGEQFSAGNYTVRCLNPSSDVKVLQLRKSDGENSVMLHTNSIVGGINRKSRLVFNRYGNQYFLSQAWLVSESLGMQAVKSRQEKATAKELARLAYKPEMVALTINR
ncbi:MAG TPA: hypothetical protein VJU84_06670 [Pyrinomonadaceae bacterium]|nr:hypothetical protein [Pyrinomonadaceae bacterium]